MSEDMHFSLASKTSKACQQQVLSYTQNSLLSAREFDWESQGQKTADEVMVKNQQFIEKSCVIMYRNDMTLFWNNVTPLTGVH